MKLSARQYNFQTNRKQKCSLRAALFLTLQFQLASIRSVECTCNQTDYKEHQEYVENYFSNRSRSRSYPRETKNSRYQRYY